MGLKKRREKREKKRVGEEKRRKKDVQLTCGPHILFLIFFAD